MRMTLLLGVVGVLAWAAAWIMRCRPILPTFIDPSRTGKRALLATGAACLATTLLLLVLLPVARQVNHTQTLTFALIALATAAQASFLAVWIATAAIFMFRDKEPLATAGLTRRNLWRSILLGLLISLLCCGTMVGKSLGKIQPLHLLLLVPNFETAFGEEFFFRGYLQSRLMSWLGKLPGWLAASVIMVLVHFPTLLFVREFDLQQAGVWCASTLAISLLLGWLMWRTGNIAASVILHLFANWINSFR